MRNNFNNNLKGEKGMDKKNIVKMMSTKELFEDLGYYRYPGQEENLAYIMCELENRMSVPEYDLLITCVY